MVTSEALAKTIDNDTKFNVRILYVLSKATLPITVHELEYLYIETFRLNFSPLAHCNKTEKANIFSTVPTVIVFSRLDKNLFLGNVNTFLMCAPSQVVNSIFSAYKSNCQLI